MRLPMRQAHLYTLAFGIAMAIAAASAAHADGLVNFGFDDGMHTNDGNNTEILSAGATDITGWTVIGSHVSWIADPNPFGLQALGGGRFLDLTDIYGPPGPPFGGVTQTVATTPGATYLLDFNLGSYTARWGGPPVGITVSAGSTSQEFDGGSATPTWDVIFWSFTATDTSTPITFVGSAGYKFIGLESVSFGCIKDCPRSGVPEPATLSLLGLGLAILGITRRRGAWADPQLPSA